MQQPIASIILSNPIDSNEGTTLLLMHRIKCESKMTVLIQSYKITFDHNY